MIYEKLINLRYDLKVTELLYSFFSNNYILIYIYIF